jgi:hypothetical protein
LVDSQRASVNITTSFQTPNRHETVYHFPLGLRLPPDHNFLPLLMKVTTTLIAMLLGISLFASSAENSSRDKDRDAKPDNKEPGKSHKGEPDQKNDRANDHRQDPKDRDDGRHDHGKSKPPKPPRPPKPPKDHTKTPTVPLQLIAAAVSEFQVNLTWVDNSTDELGFKIERSLDGTNYTQIAQVLPNTTVYRDLNRFPDTKYFYRACAFNAKGESAYSNVARTQTPAPACPHSASLWGAGGVLPAFDLIGVVAFAPGSYQIVLLRNDGTVFGWDHTGLARIPNMTNVVAIAAGASHGLALKADSTVTGWGENYSGQATSPINLTSVTAIAAGAAHSLALKSDGTVVAWGEDEWWQARPPTNLTGVVAIAAGAQHSLALRSDGTVVGWGFNDKNAAQPPPGLKNVVAIAAGFSHSLALRTDGTVVGWGQSEAAQVPPNLTDVTGIAAGMHDSLALKRDGTFVYWGSGQYSNPRPPTGVNGIVKLASGNGNNLLLATHPAPAISPLAKLIATNRVELNWQDYSAGTSSFEIRRGTVDPDDIYGGAYSFPTNASFLAEVHAGATQFVDANIVVGETYWYQINSRNECGVTTNENVAAITISVPLHPPHISSLNVHTNTAMISWNAASIGITVHRVERAADAGGSPGAWQEIATAPPTLGWYSGAYTDFGLTPNSTNWYRIRIENSLGLSPYSEPVRVVVGPPPRPRYLTAHIGDTNQVVLNWHNDRPYNVSGFKIEQANDHDGAPGPWSEINSYSVRPGYPYSYTNHGVVPGQTYWYRVRANNISGDSDYSDAAKITIALPQPNFSALSRSNSALLVIWYPWPHSITPIIATAFERAIHMETSAGHWMPVHPESIEHASWFIDRDLSTDVFYYQYRVKVLTWLGWSDFLETAVSIQPPPSAAFVRAMVGSTNRIKLVWQTAYDSDHAGFNIERAFGVETGAGPWTKVGTVGLTNSLSYAFEDIVSRRDVPHRYRISAFNAAGTSIFTESFPLTLTAPETPTLVANPFVNRVWLHWNTTFLGVTGFRIERAPDLAGTPGAWTDVLHIPPTDNWPIQHTDILPEFEAKYWYRIHAYNWLGASEFSRPVLVHVQPPAAPSFSGFQIAETNQIQLFWSHYGSDNDVFLIERASSSGGIAGPWEERFGISRAAAFTSMGFTALDSVTAGAQYQYRLRATNRIGTSTFSEVLHVSVLPPPAPVGLQAAVTGGRVTLNWGADNGFHQYGRVDGFEIERAEVVEDALGGWTRLAHTYDYSYTDSTAPPNATSWYRVRAINWVGGSDYTGPVGATLVPPNPPHWITANIGSTNRVNLNVYTRYPSDHDGFLLERAPDSNGAPGVWEGISSVFTNAGRAILTDTNALAYSTNWYRARVFHRAGQSGYSPSVSIVIVPPPAPETIALTRAGEQIQLFWQLNSHDEISGFKLERAAAAGDQPSDWSEIAQLPGEYNPSGWWTAYYTDTVTTPNMTYWYRVRAYNWIGNGTPSIERVVTTTVPNSPLWPNARIGDTNQALIDWFPSLNTTNGGYLVERTEDTNEVTANWRLIANVPPNQTYFYDTNITAFTTNWYRLRAFDLLGTSAPSAVVELRVVPPPAPSLIGANAYANRASVYWAESRSGYGNVSGYELQRALDVGGVPGAWRTLFASDLTATMDPGLTPNATYWYRVRAFNWIGQSDYSDTASVTITPPAAPRNLFAFGHSTNEIRLRWYAGNPNDQEAFAVERQSDTNAAWTMIATVPATNLSWASYSDTNVIPNVTYHYRVRAFNIVGYSAYSDMASTMIPLPSATSMANTLRIESLVATNHDVLITWSATGGTTNVVEATDDWRKAFAPISPNLIFDGTGSVTTNYLDTGTLTNSTSRFYRIRLVH